MSKERSCIHCARVVGEGRVYFGVVGPFCDVACREGYLEKRPSILTEPADTFEWVDLCLHCSSRKHDRCDWAGCECPHDPVRLQHMAEARRAAARHETVEGGTDVS